MSSSVRLLAPLAWRNLWRNPRRTGITLIVVSVGLCSILLFASLLEAWSESSRNRTLSLLTGSGQIHATGYLDDPSVALTFPAPSAELVAELNGPDLMGWAPRISVPAVLQSEYKTLPVTALGVDPASEIAISSIPDRVRAGVYLEGPGDEGIILGQKLVDRLKTRLGKRVILLSQNRDGSLSEQGFKVVGVFSGLADVEEFYAFVGLSTLQTMLGVGPELSEIAFRSHDEVSTAAAVERLSVAAPDLDIRSWRTLSPSMATMDEMMNVVVLIWLWIMFIMMAFGIINTQLMAVFERVREFGLMQALGMRPRAILVLILLESTMLIGFGALIGVVLALLFLLSMAGGVDMSALTEGAALAGAGEFLYPQIHPVQIIWLTAVVWLLGVIVTLWPARKAAKSSPVEAMTHVS